MYLSFIHNYTTQTGSFYYTNIVTTSFTIHIDIVVFNNTKCYITNLRLYIINYFLHIHLIAINYKQRS